MPSRIYEIASKLGLENKQVLAKARQLGISGASVASSALDKITAEYLEQQLLLDKSPPPQELPLMAPEPAPAQGSGAQASSPAITVKAVGLEIHALFEKVLAGQIPFTVEICRQEGLAPLRAKFVQLVGETPGPEWQAPKPAVPTPRAELDDRTKDLFRAAYYSARHVSKDDWVNLAEYGSALKRQDPTFQPQDFGERSLGTLVRRMMDDFEIRADESTPPVHYIRLRRDPATPYIQPPPQPPPSQQPGPRRLMRGRIHNLKLGFGFIAPEDGSQNAFFHASEVIGCTIFDLRPGDPVEYEAGFNERGACAWKVRKTMPIGAILRDITLDHETNEASDPSASPQGRRQTVHPTEVRLATFRLRINRANQIPLAVANWVLATGRPLPEMPNFLHPDNTGFAKSAQTKQLDNGWYIEVGDSFDTLMQKGRRLLDAGGFPNTPLEVVLEDGTVRTV